MWVNAGLGFGSVARCVIHPGIVMVVPDSGGKSFGKTETVDSSEGIVLVATAIELKVNLAQACKQD